MFSFQLVAVLSVQKVFRWSAHLSFNASVFQACNYCKEGMHGKHASLIIRIEPIDWPAWVMAHEASSKWRFHETVCAHEAGSCLYCPVLS